MSTKKWLMHTIFAVAITAVGVSVHAQDQRPGYGPMITLEQAKRLAASAAAEARKNNWNMAIAVVDNYGQLIYYERMEDTQTASAAVAVEKARTAAMYRRSTRVFQDGINKGGTPSVASLTGVMPVAGGLPIMVGGKVTGGLGVSGATSDQDEQCARVALEGMK
jgi:glc operon protein GlcG